MKQKHSFNYEKDCTNKKTFRGTSTVFKTQCEFSGCENIELMSSKRFGFLVNEDSNFYYICSHCHNKQVKEFKRNRDILYPKHNKETKMSSQTLINMLRIVTPIEIVFNK